MSAELQSVLDAALKLSDDDREALAERLWESLDDEDADEEAFAAELQRRIDESNRDPSSLMPWERVREMR